MPKKYEVEYCDYCTTEILSDFFHIKNIPLSLSCQNVERVIGGRTMIVYTNNILTGSTVIICSKCKKILDKALYENIMSRQPSK